MTITELIMRLIVLMFLALIAVAGLSGVGLVAWWLGGLVFWGVLQ